MSAKEEYGVLSDTAVQVIDHCNRRDNARLDEADE